MVAVAQRHRPRGLGLALSKHVIADDADITWVLRAEHEGAVEFFGSSDSMPLSLRLSGRGRSTLRVAARARLCCPPPVDLASAARIGRDAWIRRGTSMKALILFVGWCILFVLCWPIALLALLLWPVVWLVSLPFRLIGMTFEALFALLRAILFLPARILGYRGRRA